MKEGDIIRMIGIIIICNKRFHYYEFIKPIEDILKKNNIEFQSIHYKNISDDVLNKAEKIIISGTSLKDNGFVKDKSYFNWIKKLNIPILGICGGMHILGLIFDGELKKQQEIGLTNIELKKEFLGLIGKIEVYELHNFYAISNEFEIFGMSKNCPQAVKHKKYPFFGVLFHPEVRNKDLIVNFVNI
jgi:GMP synthase (glutamine-hydrolysing)